METSFEYFHTMTNIQGDSSWKEQFFESLQEKDWNAFIQFLLQKKLFNKRNIRKYEQQTVLSNAAEYGDWDVVHYLVKKGADVDAPSCNGTKPLNVAAVFGHLKIVELFLNFGASVNSCDWRGFTPLHEAAKKGNKDIVELLVGKGANINAKNSFDYTPILLAAGNNHKDVVILLINLGASLDCYTDTKWTVLHYAIREEWLDIVETLALFGADLDAKNSLGHTSLLIVARARRRSDVQMLIGLGADVHCYEEDGKGLLHYAAQHGWYQIVQSLVGRRVAVDATNSEGSPLVLAAKYGRKDIVEFLIAVGANVNIYDGKGYGALHYVAGAGWVDVARSLVKKHVEINAVSDDGTTPLHIACIADKYAMNDFTDYLLEAGANCNAKDQEGKTPLNYCPKTESVVRTFIDHGAYFTLFDMKALFRNGFLTDVQLCTESFVNKFNNNDLQKLYVHSSLVKILPCIDQMKIKLASGVSREIEHAVQRDMQVKQYCNLMQVRPIILKMLCVKSLIAYFGENTIN